MALPPIFERQITVRSPADSYSDCALVGPTKRDPLGVIYEVSGAHGRLSGLSRQGRGAFAASICQSHITVFPVDRASAAQRAFRLARCTVHRTAMQVFPRRTAPVEVDQDARNRRRHSGGSGSLIARRHRCRSPIDPRAAQVCLDPMTGEAGPFDVAGAIILHAATRAARIAGRVRCPRLFSATAQRSAIQPVSCPHRPQTNRIPFPTPGRWPTLATLIFATRGRRGRSLFGNSIWLTGAYGRFVTRHDRFESPTVLPIFYAAEHEKA